MEPIKKPLRTPDLGEGQRPRPPQHKLSRLEKLEIQRLYGIDTRPDPYLGGHRWTDT